jgi:hypothetical protein
MRKRTRVGALGLAVAAVVGLGACGHADPAPAPPAAAASTPASTPAETPTPAASTAAIPVPIVDQGMFRLLTAMAESESTAHTLVDRVCTLPQTPTELIAMLAKEEPSAKVYVRTAVMAGCPQKKDWQST